MAFASEWHPFPFSLRILIFSGILLFFSMPKQTGLQWECYLLFGSLMVNSARELAVILNNVSL